jgi:hypothetical protein
MPRIVRSASTVRKIARDWSAVISQCSCGRHRNTHTSADYDASGNCRHAASRQAKRAEYRDKMCSKWQD